MRRLNIVIDDAADKVLTGYQDKTTNGKKKTCLDKCVSELLIKAGKGLNEPL